MKLKTRIIVGFVAIILLPLLLFSASLYGFSQTQAKHVPGEQQPGFGFQPDGL